MAETYTQDGLHNLYRTTYCGSSAVATFYVGLFVSATPSTVPASTASGASSGWTEMSAATGTYARQSVPASTITTSGVVGASAVGSTWPQVTFTGFTSASPANGFFISNGSVGSAGSPLLFANFDSGASRSLLTTSDTLAVTPALRGTP